VAKNMTAEARGAFWRASILDRWGSPRRCCLTSSNPHYPARSTTTVLGLIRLIQTKFPDGVSGDDVESAWSNPTVLRVIHVLRNTTSFRSLRASAKPSRSSAVKVFWPYHYGSTSSSTKSLVWSLRPPNAFLS